MLNELQVAEANYVNIARCTAKVERLWILSLDLIRLLWSRHALLFGIIRRLIILTESPPLQPWFVGPAQSHGNGAAHSWHPKWFISLLYSNFEL